MAQNRWQLSPRARLQADAQGGALFDTWQAELSHCNGSAWTLLECLRDGADEAELVQALTARYQVQQAEARKDVQRIVGQLRTRGLLENAD
ncbi:MAG: HPr-rel-A system PqqD family peptide chaperone [Betaproteobacteria bacterium]|nr:HPr-rel-A system PqqD family peptide chaperone [Betaproteobacteria bacterium]